jgi:hypothetical protein
VPLERFTGEGSVAARFQASYTPFSYTPTKVAVAETLIETKGERAGWPPASL